MIIGKKIAKEDSTGKVGSTSFVIQTISSIVHGKEMPFQWNRTITNNSYEIFYENNHDKVAHNYDSKYETTSFTTEINKKGIQV